MLSNVYQCNTNTHISGLLGMPYHGAKWGEQRERVYKVTNRSQPCLHALRTDSTCYYVLLGDSEHSQGQTDDDVLRKKSHYAGVYWQKLLVLSFSVLEHVYPY